jgi:predicted molibdopterin-dependent oxidoreductase YjgC
VVVELLPTPTVERADVVLPSVAYAEREATFTNLERRLQKLEPLLSPPGSAREPWAVCAAVAAALGDEWGWSSFDDLWADIRRDVPTHAAVDVEALAQRRPPNALNYESPYARQTSESVAGPGAGYPKGHRSGAPFETGFNWPLSWELRAFEAKQRPGQIPDVPEAPSPIEPPERLAHRRARSEGEFLLYSGRLIYDEGHMVSKSKALLAIARKPFVEMAERDMARLGLAEGDEALVSADGFEARVPARAADIAAGSVFIPYAQEGLRANALMSSLDPVVRVTKA